jgi:uncharacterized protein affecting Mg2+/Co2+ transport
MFSVKIRNDGPKPLNITNQQITGVDAGLFSFVSGGSDATLNEGETHEATIEFSQTTKTGELDASYECTTDDPDNATITIPIFKFIIDRTNFHDISEDKATGSQIDAWNGWSGDVSQFTSKDVSLFDLTKVWSFDSYRGLYAKKTITNSFSETDKYSIYLPVNTSEGVEHGVITLIGVTKTSDASSYNIHDETLCVLMTNSSLANKNKIGVYNDGSKIVDFDIPTGDLRVYFSFENDGSGNINYDLVVYNSDFYHRENGAISSELFVSGDILYYYICNGSASLHTDSQIYPKVGKFLVGRN